MMHLVTLFSVLVLASPSALAAPLQRRNSINIKIFSPPEGATAIATATGETFSCSAAQVTEIKEAIADAEKLAKDSIRVLSSEGVAENSFYGKFYGTAAPQTVIEHHFTAIAGSIASIEIIPKLTRPAAGEVNIYCSNQDAKLDNELGDGNKGAEASDALSFVKIRPDGFKLPATFAVGGAKISLSLVMIHEFQHLSRFTGAGNTCGDLAYSLAACTKLEADKKVTNAQNHLFWAAFHTRFIQCPPAEASSSEHTRRIFGLGGSKSSTSTPKSGTAKIVTTKSGTAKSGTAQSGAAKSGTVKSGTTTPETAKLGTAKSGTVKSGNTKSTGSPASSSSKSGAQCVVPNLPDLTPAVFDSSQPATPPFVKG